MTFRLWRVSLLLFGSGLCALVYQIAWFRELRLIFGASTAASSAVLAIFMGGLGLGGFVLGKRADRVDNPLRFYAHLEIGVAITAALTPLLVGLAQSIYFASGGSPTLGSFGATLLRLLLSIVILGPSTFLMGGTLPSAARAVEREADASRSRVAVLYATNTAGAVTGAVCANFLLLEVFGTRLTLWLACLVNVLVGVLARVASNRTTDTTPETADAAAEQDEDEDEDEDEDADAPLESTAAKEQATRRPWFPPIAACIAGFAFMLMELVWYRMLAPLLGGSSYTFGLILAVALAGIAIGGGLYARVVANWAKRTRVRTRESVSTPALFALTCALEALFLVVPYALGDRLALLALSLRPLTRISFGASVLVWAVIAGITVLPAAIVSGVQFPCIIGLYGKGKKAVARDVGSAYLANTIGAILGALGGGFGLLPLLNALRCWIFVVIMLLVTAAVAAVVVKQRRPAIQIEMLLAGAAGALAIGCLFFATGPTAFWRESGIGAGRADEAITTSQPGVLEAVRRPSPLAWERDGVESTVGLEQTDGYTFIVNGKSDGNAIVDAPTQVMGGLVGALNHPHPKTAFVVGLGTGSTAGWLGAIPEMERVDVVELEPAVLDVARACHAVNHDAMSNPKINVSLGDAREVLRSTPRHYDVVFSEPSNPYRAGISSLYTIEFYRAVAERLNEHGVFVQWLQTYDIDRWVIATVLTTLREVFPSVTLWKTTQGDLLALGETTKDGKIDVARLRARIQEEPWASAIRDVWHTTTVEGILARHIGAPDVTDAVVENHLGAVNTDDQNFLEFAFARNVGVRSIVDNDVERLATRLGFTRPRLLGTIDEKLFLEERVARGMTDGIAPNDPSARSLANAMQEMSTSSNPFVAMDKWLSLSRTPTTFVESQLVARTAAGAGHPQLETWLAPIPSEAHREILRARWAAAHDDPDAMIAKLAHAFVLLRDDPWVPQAVIAGAFLLGSSVISQRPEVARPLLSALAEPFAAEISRIARLSARIQLAHALGDFELCRNVIDELGPPRWDSLLATRADCLRQVHDPRAAEALDLAYAFLAQTEVLGDTIRTSKPVSSGGAQLLDKAPNTVPDAGSVGSQNDAQH